MNEVRYEGGMVHATTDPRVVRGLLLPFNEEGRTNLGKFKVAPDKVTVPRDPMAVGFNTDHIREANVARAVSLEVVTEGSDVQPAGVYASLRFHETPEGDAALADALSPTGKRRKLSAEFGPAVIRNGELANVVPVWGGALVEAGAFPSAMVMAADVGELPEDDAPTAVPAVITVPEDGILVLETTALPTEVTLNVSDDQGETTETATYQPVVEEASTEGEPVLATATAPKTTPTGAPKSAPTPPAAPDVEPRQIFAAMSAVQSRTDHDGSALAFLLEHAPQGQNVFAALNDIKYTTAGGVGAGINQIPAWLGKMYSGRKYRRRYATLFGASKPLTSMSVAGWDWGVKPEGASYAGNKANVPTNTPTVVPFADTAERWAGGHDHDRAFVDFPNPEYWESYYEAMIESYELWFDTLVFEKAVEGATSVEADNPAGLSIGAGLSALIDGAVEVINAGGIPTFGIMSTDLYKQTLKTPLQDTLGYLNAALDFEEGTLQSAGFKLLGAPTTAVEAGHVVVGDGAAAQPYELGGAPVRVDALDMVKGGVDTGVFGYGAFYINKASLIVDVEPYVAGP